MRNLSLLITLLFTAPAWGLAGPAPMTAAPASTSASAAVTAKNFQPGQGKSVHLGKIEVPGVKPLVETLQEIKVAVKRPFDNDPAHFDDMVCRLDAGTLDSHAGTTLECGTQGWFSMRRNQNQFGNGDAAAVAALGHPWHTVRRLSGRQVKTLREVLRELPLPAHGEVQVIDDGKAPLEGSP